MTREEQIIEASYNYSKTLNEEGVFDYEDMKCAFRDGAEWADEHPKIMLRDANEEPTNKDANLLCFCKYMERPLLFPCGWLIDNLKSWEDAVRKLTITHWLYTEDIVPKD